MSNMANNIFRAGVFAVSLFGFAIGANAADETCDPMPDCEALGYVKDADCKQNTYVSCPYDTSYKRCVNNDCEALGYTETDKKSWCKEIVPCPTDASYTLCQKKCADCTTGERAPYCPFGRLAAGADECGNQCYTCAECTYDKDRGYDNDEYASLQCSASQFVTTVIKPLCPENTALKYVCSECPDGMIASEINSTTCVCDEANSYFRACPTGAFCDIYHSKTFGSCYKPANYRESRPPVNPGGGGNGGSSTGDDEEECLPTDPLYPNCCPTTDPRYPNCGNVVSTECTDCEDECEGAECYCDPRKGYVSYKISDNHFTYGPVESFKISATETARCKLVTGCSGYEGSTDAPVFDTEHFNKTYFEIVDKQLPTPGGPTCYWVKGCSGDPYVEKTGSSDPCCTGRVYRQARTQGGHTCGVCPCDEDNAYYSYTPVGRIYSTNNCSYQVCNHATACDADVQHYTSTWSDLHFNYPDEIVRLPECKYVIGCNINLQGAKSTDFTAVQKSYFTTTSTTNGARTCYYITGCNTGNNPKREDNCDAIELRWVSGDPMQMGGYTCGTCECDISRGYYTTCPTGATCDKVGRCYKTKIGGTADPDNDGCNNSTGYVLATDSRTGDNAHFTYGDQVSFNIDTSAKTCVLITGCNSSVDGATTTAPSKGSSQINTDYYTYSSKQRGATTCYWTTGCKDDRVVSSGACSTARGYKDSSCRDHGGRHCCVCTTLTCSEQYSGTSYVVHTTSSSITNYDCTATDKKQADSTCYDCVCNSSHCNGTNCGTQTVSCPTSTYPYTYCQHASRGNSCDTITRNSNSTCNTSYTTRYEKCDCINNGSNECYKRNTAGTDCTALTCSDYNLLEASQRDTERYTYTEYTKCSGTTTRKCYEYKGCNTSYGHYDTEALCLAANSCNKTCKKNAYGCYYADSTKDCSYNTSYPKGSCDTDCFDCSSKTTYCGQTCWNPVAKNCGSYSLSASCPTDHYCPTATKSLGNSSSYSCYNDTCHDDKGCNTSSGYYDSNAACLDAHPGYSACKQRASGCWSTAGGTAKTCADYPGHTSSLCNDKKYVCTDSITADLGDTTGTCFNPVPKDCPDSYPTLSSNTSVCNNYSCDNFASGETTIRCCKDTGAKTCAELDSSYGDSSSCTSSNPGYACTSYTPSSCRTCYKTNGCDSNHCGTNCATAKNTCSDYPYTAADIPANATGFDTCTTQCTGTSTLKYKTWGCNPGYTVNAAGTGCQVACLSGSYASLSECESNVLAQETCQKSGACYRPYCTQSTYDAMKMMATITGYSSYTCEYSESDGLDGGMGHHGATGFCRDERSNCVATTGVKNSYDHVDGYWHYVGAFDDYCVPADERVTSASGPGGKGGTTSSYERKQACKATLENLKADYIDVWNSKCPKHQIEIYYRFGSAEANCFSGLKDGQECVY